GRGQLKDVTVSDASGTSSSKVSPAPSIVHIRTPDSDKSVEIRNGDLLVLLEKVPTAIKDLFCLSSSFDDELIEIVGRSSSLTRPLVSISTGSAVAVAIVAGVSATTFALSTRTVRTRVSKQKTLDTLLKCIHH